MGKYCSLADYVAGVGERFQVEELQLGEHYLFMAALKPNSYNLEALQAQARIDDIELHRAGPAVVHFSLVSSEHCREDAHSGNFAAGFWLDAPRAEVVKGIRTSEAYFKFDEEVLNDTIVALQSIGELPDIFQAGRPGIATMSETENLI